MSAPASQPISLAGKVALVTGGSRGLGEGIARILGSAGASLFLTARDAERLGEAAAALSASGYDVAVRTGSAADPPEAHAAVSDCMRRFGRLDILVNNAGVAVATPLLDPDWDGVKDLWDLNYFAPWRFFREAWHAFMGEHGGSVVNISSTAAYRARSTVEAYGMSKLALCDLTRRLAAAAGPRVRVNAITPGVVATEQNRAFWAAHGTPPGIDPSGNGQWPLRRSGEIDDIAAAALYLSSDASSWVTGQVIAVDGGASLP